MTTYYINADSGLDDISRDGSSAQPWLTFSYAYSKSSSLDTIICQASTSHYLWETVQIEHTITLRCENLGDAIFDAGGSDLTYGFYMVGANTTVMENLMFTGLHQTTGQHHGFWADYGTLQCTNCVFYNNVIDNSIYASIFGFKRSDCTASMEFTACLFYGTTSNNNCPIFFNASEAIYQNTLKLLNCTLHWDASVGQESSMMFYNGGTSVYNYELTNCIILNEQAASVDFKFAQSVFEYNCYYGSFSNLGPIGSGCLNTDPLMVDAANRIYRLRRDSPCIDAGTII